MDQFSIFSLVLLVVTLLFFAWTYTPTGKKWIKGDL